MKRAFFYSNEVSEYGAKHGFVDYHAFTKSFDAVLNNDLMGELENKGFYFELENGFLEYRIDEDGTHLTPDEAEEIISELEDSILESEDENEIGKLEERKACLEEEHFEYDIYQYFVVSDFGANLIKEYTNELLWYCEELDLYIWGVCHWGTSWDYVLTEIPCNPREVGENEQ